MALIVGIIFWGIFLGIAAGSAYEPLVAFLMIGGTGAFLYYSLAKQDEKWGIIFNVIFLFFFVTSCFIKITP